MDKKQSLSVPVAIVIAGIIIAGAVFFSGDDSTSVTEDQIVDRRVDIDINPVSSSDHILGSPSADIVIVEFSDTECPFCKNFHFSMHRLIDTYGKDGQVAWVYRHFPIEQLHSKAPQEAEATECAAAQGKFWEYIDRVFEDTTSNDGLPTSQLSVIAKEIGLNVNAFDQCVSTGQTTANVAAQEQDALDSGGRGTPHNVLILKDPISALQESALRDIFIAQPDIISIDADRDIINLSGALPYDLMESIIKIIQG